jgi:predicted nucleic acid-binding protein
MPSYFFDSSALAKVFLAETGTEWMREVISTTENRFIASITGVEVVSAIARRQRTGGLSDNAAAMAISTFRQDYSQGYLQVEVSDSIVIAAMDLAETYGLRGYDAVQLAAAIEVNVRAATIGLTAVTLVSADSKLNGAAVAEGLQVEDPNAHP